MSLWPQQQTLAAPLAEARGRHRLRQGAFVHTRTRQRRKPRVRLVIDCQEHASAVEHQRHRAAWLARRTIDHTANEETALLRERGATGPVESRIRQRQTSAIVRASGAGDRITLSRARRGRIHLPVASAPARVSGGSMSLKG